MAADRFRGTEIDRDLKSTAADRNSTVLQYPKLMQSSRRDHSINFSDKTYGCLSGLSCRCFFKAMNFSDHFRQCFKLFYSFEKQLFMDFLESPKKILKKTSVMNSRFIRAAKRRI